jgi:hypothetical protein
MPEDGGKLTNSIATVVACGGKPMTVSTTLGASVQLTMSSGLNQQLRRVARAT